MHLRKRGKNFYASWTGPDGRTVQQTTGCETRAAAEQWARRKERELADPAYAAAESASLEPWCERFLQEVRRRVATGKTAKGTLAMYEQKVGHLLRVLDDCKLSTIDARKFAAYIEQRRSEKAKDSTIYKEFVSLTQVLNLARHVGDYGRDPSSLKPPWFSNAYTPRKVWLTLEQVDKLLDQLTPERVGAVAFVVATGVRESELWSARLEDVGAWTLRVRGTKTEGSRREIPIPLVMVPLFLRALDLRVGDERLFRAWPNDRRDLERACERAGVPRVTWNDLRRTFASLLLQDGESLYVVSKLMGHSTTRMLELVYGQQTPETLGRLLQNQGRIHAAPVQQRSLQMVDKVDVVDDVESGFSRGIGGPAGTRTRDLRIKSPSEIANSSENAEISPSDATPVQQSSLRLCAAAHAWFTRRAA